MQPGRRGRGFNRIIWGFTSFKPTASARRGSTNRLRETSARARAGRAGTCLPLAVQKKSVPNKHWGAHAASEPDRLPV